MSANEAAGMPIRWYPRRFFLVQIVLQTYTNHGMVQELQLFGGMRWLNINWQHS
jgi:hypothetical protein